MNAFNTNLSTYFTNLQDKFKTIKNQLIKLNPNLPSIVTTSLRILTIDELKRFINLYTNLTIDTLEEFINLFIKINTNNGELEALCNDNISALPLNINDLISIDKIQMFLDKLQSAHNSNKNLFEPLDSSFNYSTDKDKNIIRNMFIESLDEDIKTKYINSITNNFTFIKAQFLKFLASKNDEINKTKNKIIFFKLKHKYLSLHYFKVLWKEEQKIGQF